MADDIHLADFREVLDFDARVPCPQGLDSVYCGHIEIGKLIAVLAGRADLEQQLLILRGMRADLFDHAKASATRSICGFLLISVQHNSMVFLSSG